MKDIYRQGFKTCIPLHTLSKYDVPVRFVGYLSFEAVYCFICGHRRVAVTRYRMIFIVLAKTSLPKKDTFSITGYLYLKRFIPSPILNYLSHI